MERLRIDYTASKEVREMKYMGWVFVICGLALIFIYTVYESM